jgi:hypothetical protein
MLLNCAADDDDKPELGWITNLVALAEWQTFPISRVFVAHFF